MTIIVVQTGLECWAYFEGKPDKEGRGKTKEEAVFNLIESYPEFGVRLQMTWH